jgi:urease
MLRIFPELNSRTVFGIAVDGGRQTNARPPACTCKYLPAGISAKEKPSVVTGLHEIQIEGTFKDGTYLVTVHDPICSDDGDLSKALAGSFFPIPSADLFTLPDANEYSPDKQPGAVLVENGTIILNKGRTRHRLKVTNRGDRPIQVLTHQIF